MQKINELDAKLLQFGKDEAYITENDILNKFGETYVARFKKLKSDYFLKDAPVVINSDGSTGDGESYRYSLSDDGKLALENYEVETK